VPDVVSGRPRGNRGDRTEEGCIECESGLRNNISINLVPIRLQRHVGSARPLETQTISIPVALRHGAHAEANSLVRRRGRKTSPRRHFCFVRFVTPTVRADSVDSMELERYSETDMFFALSFIVVRDAGRARCTNLSAMAHTRIGANKRPHSRVGMPTSEGIEGPQGVGSNGMDPFSPLTGR